MCVCVEPSGGVWCCHKFLADDLRMEELCPSLQHHVTVEEDVVRIIFAALESKPFPKQWSSGISELASFL